MTKLLLIISLFLIPLNVFAALRFGVASSDRVDYGSATNLDNLDPFTYCAWIYPITITNNRAIVSKATAAGTGNFWVVATSGNMSTTVNRGTADTIYTTNDTSIATTSKWYFVCSAYNSAGGSGLVVKMYTGTLSTVVAKDTNGTATNGSGTNDDNSSINLDVGNLNAASPANAFQGNIAWVGVWNRELSLGEIRGQQFYPHVTRGNVLFTWLGFNKTKTQTDYSLTGNPGTVTGATVNAPNAPISPRFH